MSTPVPDQWLSLCDIDRARGWPKGQAFRAFKALAPHWQEGCDYRVLDAPEILATWRRDGRLYPSSVRLIVLAPQAAAQLAARS